MADRMARLPVTGDRLYEMGMAAMAQTAAGMTRLIQNGSLHRYLLTIIGVFTLATAGIWALNAAARPGLLHPPSLPIAQWLLVTLMAAALGVVVVARSRVLAVCALGVVGSGAASYNFV